MLPVLQSIQDHILPLQKQIDWGYHIPYMISGSLNEHPKRAMEWMDSDLKDDFVAFLKNMHDKEILE